MTIIDTHAHIYSEDTSAYPLCPEPYLPPQGLGTLGHLRAEMRANGVYRTVLVHTFTAYRWDNRLLADVAGDARDFTAGVCALNPEDPSSLRLLEIYHRDFNVRGLRVFPLEGPGGQRTLELPGHLALWEKCAELGVVVCVLMNPPHVPELRRLLARYPLVPVVLDHCANLSAEDDPAGENVESILSLSEFPNLYAKLSFLVTGSKEEFPFRDTHAVARRILEAFGSDWCMWGSDFPCELWIPKASYADHLRLFTGELGLSESAQAAVLGETAHRVWFPEVNTG